MKLRELQKNTGEFLLKPQNKTEGIFDFGIKFFLVLLLYTASFVILIHDPFFLVNGAVWYQQGAIPLFLAFTVMTALCWEMLIFGAPRGANLLLQTISFFPAGLLSARLFSRAAKFPLPTITGEILKQVKTSLYSLFPIPDIPDFLIELCSNWKITILFSLVVLMLSLRLAKQIKIAGIAVLAITGLTLEVISGNAEYLAIGTALFGIGLGLQFCRYDKVRIYRNILDKLDRMPKKDELLFRSILRIAAEVQQNGSLSDRRVRSIVQSEYGNQAPYSPEEIDQITKSVVDKMLNELGIADLQISGGISLLTLKPQMEQYAPVLCSIAVFPRLIFIFIFSVIWILNPLDLIPDCTPFFGTLDDVAAGLVSFLVIQSSINQSAAPGCRKF